MPCSAQSFSQNEAPIWLPHWAFVGQRGLYRSSEATHLSGLDCDDLSRPESVSAAVVEAQMRTNMVRQQVEVDG